MNIAILIIAAIGGLLGVLSVLYLTIGIPVVIIWKFYRKLRYGLKMYD